ncbi:Large ribosomal subunit protein bL32m [[Candida] zeylanoides]|jgi:ribosomal protein L32
MSIALKSGGLIAPLSLLPAIPSIALGLNGGTFRRLGEVIGESLRDIGILWAAPKKRPSKARTRQNFLSAGSKQIKHMTNIVRCPACGHVKRSHFMCMHCFAEIKQFLKGKKKQDLGEQAEFHQELDAVDDRILYPGKFETQFQQRMKSRDWVPKREEPLMFEASEIAKKTKKDYSK